MLLSGCSLLPNSGRILVPVSEGCCLVHNANIQVIQPLFSGEAVILFGPGYRHLGLGGVCNARWDPWHDAPNRVSTAQAQWRQWENQVGSGQRLSNATSGAAGGHPTLGNITVGITPPYNY